MNHKSWFGKCVGVCVALTEPLDIVKISIQVRCRLRTERKTAAVKLGQEIEMERERERERERIFTDFYDLGDWTFNVHENPFLNNLLGPIASVTKWLGSLLNIFVVKSGNQHA